MVVAYGKILPGYMLSYPAYGCINLHGSLLPAYRGAAPMQRAVMDGVKEIGVTTMYMEQGLDTGDMLEKWSAPLPEDADFGYVHDLLAYNGAELLVSTLRRAQAGTLTPEKQDGARATYAAKIEKADCLIDWSARAKEIHDRVRGLSPVPLAFTFLCARNLKIVKPGGRLRRAGNGAVLYAGRRMRRLRRGHTDAAVAPTRGQGHNERLRFLQRQRNRRRRPLHGTAKQGVKNVLV